MKFIKIWVMFSKQEILIFFKKSINMCHYINGLFYVESILVSNINICAQKNNI